MEDVLKEGGAIYDPKFNFNTHINVRKDINGIKCITKKVPVIEALLEPNTIPSRLYGMIKLHKTGFAMKPVVSFISAPTYRLAKFLNNWIKSVTTINSPFSIENSVDLANKIQSIDIPLGSQLISFDVKALYPSTPLRVAIETGILSGCYPGGG